MSSADRSIFLRATVFILVSLIFAATTITVSAQSAPSTKPSGSQPQSAADGVKTDSKVPDWQTAGVPNGMDAKTMAPTYTTIQEDWGSLSIGVSKLTPDPPLPAETDQFDSFTRQLVQVKWRPGDPIDLYVILPKGVKKPPVVLYLYNFSEDTDRFKDDRWCERVTNGGVAAVGFVSALSGHRFHDRPLRQWFVSELQESLGSTVHDVKFILDYLATRGDLDRDLRGGPHVGQPARRCVRSPV